MSIVNEALKRAQETQSKATTARGPEFQVVEPQRRGGSFGVWIGLIVAILLAAAAFLVWAWFETMAQP